MSKKYEVTINNKKIRISIIIIDIVILIALFFPTLTLKNIYLKVFFRNDKFLDFAGYGTNNHYYAMYGCTQGTYGVFLNSIKSEPKDYNEDSLEKELKAIDNLNDENFLGNPNIIVVLSESFFDVDKISEVKFDKEITTNFDSIKESQYCVNTISPSYGGMSENAAFELPAEDAAHQIAGAEHADKADDIEQQTGQYLHWLLSYLALVRTNSNILSLNSPAQPLLMGTVMSLSSSISSPPFPATQL